MLSSSDFRLNDSIGIFMAKYQNVNAFEEIVLFGLRIGRKLKSGKGNYSEI